MPAGIKGYAWEVIIWIDQGFSVLSGGYADETFSARCYRRRHASYFMWCARKFVNGLFFWMDDHCKQAYESEKCRRQLPPEYRSDP